MSGHRPRLGLFGADGRMGRRVIESLDGFPDLELVASVDVASPPGVDFADCAVVIDFAVAGATDALLARLATGSAALVTGVTGRSEAHEEALRARSERAPVLAAANFSVGVAILRQVVEQAARAAGPDWDVEIFELHHGRKADAPSGTALALGRSASRGLDLSWPGCRAPVRDGPTGPRAPEQVGVAALRGGDVTGEHTVFLLGDGERLELTHRVRDRRVFALGALRAARWVVGRPPGLYGIRDMLAHGHLTP